MRGEFRVSYFGGGPSVVKIKISLSAFATRQPLWTQVKVGWGCRTKSALSKSFIPDPLFLSSKNGHKNHLRKIWSEKCPFFAFCWKVWVSKQYKIQARIFVWFLKIRATFLHFFDSKTWKFLWEISEFLCWILKFLWVIRKFLYCIFAESKSLQKFLNSAFYFEENRVSKLFTFSSISFAFSGGYLNSTRAHASLPMDSETK